MPDSRGGGNNPTVGGWGGGKDHLGGGGGGTTGVVIGGNQRKRGSRGSKKVWSVKDEKKLHARGAKRGANVRQGEKNQRPEPGKDWGGWREGVGIVLGLG